MAVKITQETTDVGRCWAGEWNQWKIIYTRIILCEWIKSKSHCPKLNSRDTQASDWHKSTGEHLWWYQTAAVVTSQGEAFGRLWSCNAGLMTSFSERWTIWPPLSQGSTVHAVIFTGTPPSSSLLEQFDNMSSFRSFVLRVYLYEWNPDVRRNHNGIHDLRSHMKTESH